MEKTNRKIDLEANCLIVKLVCHVANAPRNDVFARSSPARSVSDVANQTLNLFLCFDATYYCLMATLIEPFLNA